MGSNGQKDEILVAVAAKRLGFKGPRRVYQLIQEGKLEAVKRSKRKTYIKTESLIAFQSCLNDEVAVF